MGDEFAVSLGDEDEAVRRDVRLSNEIGEILQLDVDAEHGSQIPIGVAQGGR